MKKFYPLMIILAVSGAFGVSTAWAASQAVCHFPPGNPANFHTITVGGNAVNAHVTNHGDLVGSCLANCEAICDDGNACTIDVEPNPDLCICAAAPRAQVDCSDGNACTADSCDAASGSCVNDPAPLDGNSCDDDNSNTIGEVCVSGSCDPPCPCFTGSDLVANGAITVCGNNFPGFPNLAGMRWLNGGVACAGDACFSPRGTLTCGIASPVTPVNSTEVTPQENQNCQALLLANCPNPNLAPGGLVGEKESTTPFVDG